MRKNTQTRDEFCSTVELSAPEQLKEYSVAEASANGAHSDSADRPERILASDRQREEREQREAEQKIERCLLYMMQNLNARVTISALSSQAGVSASYFYSLFRRATGYSPGDFLIRARMRRACELLKDTSLKVKEVAALLGYGDQFYFSRQFKAVTRLTPSEYRGSAADSTLTQNSTPFNSWENESSKHFLNRYLSMSKNGGGPTRATSRVILQGTNLQQTNLQQTNGDANSIRRLVTPILPISSANKAVATVKPNPKP